MKKKENAQKKNTNKYDYHKILKYFNFHEALQEFPAQDLRINQDIRF